MGLNKGITELNVLNSIRYGIAGGVMLDYANAQDNVASFHHEPHKIINYVSAHDDETLRDFNYIKNTNDDETLELLQKQSNTFILTSQGIPFLHAGVDFMRSKPVTEADGATSDNRVVKGTSGNSYNLPDTVNQLNWENKAKYYDVYNYYRHLIAFRRIMPSLRLNSPEAIKQRLEFIDPENNKQLMYRIKGDDNTPDIVVVHTNKSFGSFTTDKDYIRITNNMAQADAHGFMKVPKGTKLSLIEFSSLILVEDNGKFNYNPGAQPYNFSTPRSASRNVGLILGITIPIVVLAIAGIVVLITIKKRKSL